MNLYLISQRKNHGWDTYDSAVVCAETEEDARKIHPGAPSRPLSDKPTADEIRWYYTGWTKPRFVQVQLLGEAVPGHVAGSVICASFNAG